MPIKMIVGLGNPGKRYETTRHNIGFLVIDEIFKACEVKSTQDKFKASFAQVSYKGNSFIIVKPQTYMNLSGEAVISIANYFKIPASEILVICDDLDLPVGKIRLRERGSSGGQKGLQNIIQMMSTQEIPRIRFGIGKNPLIETSDYVLGQFEKESIDLVKTGIIQAKDAALLSVEKDFVSAMNQFNKR
jgi:peptidyl-tRNA hydrolase, PTH1 family